MQITNEMNKSLSENISDLFPADKVFIKSTNLGTELTGSFFILGELFEHLSKNKQLCVTTDKNLLVDKKMDVIGTECITDEKINSFSKLILTSKGAYNETKKYIEIKQDELSSHTLKLQKLFPTVADSICNITEFWNGYSIYVFSEEAQRVLNNGLKFLFPSIHVSEYSPLKVELYDLANKKKFFKDFLNDTKMVEILNPETQQVKPKEIDLPPLTDEQMAYFMQNEKVKNKANAFFLEKFRSIILPLCGDFEKDILSFEFSSQKCAVKASSPEKAKSLAEFLSFLLETKEGVHCDKCFVIVNTIELKNLFSQNQNFTKDMPLLQEITRTIKEEFENEINRPKKNRHDDEELIDDYEMRQPSYPTENRIPLELGNIHENGGNFRVKAQLCHSFPEFSKGIISFNKSTFFRDRVAEIVVDKPQTAEGLVSQIKMILGDTNEIYCQGSRVFIKSKETLDTLLSIIN